MGYAVYQLGRKLERSVGALNAKDLPDAASGSPSPGSARRVQASNRTPSLLAFGGAQPLCETSDCAAVQTASP